MFPCTLRLDCTMRPPPAFIRVNPCYSGKGEPVNCSLSLADPILLSNPLQYVHSRPFVQSCLLLVDCISTAEGGRCPAEAASFPSVCTGAVEGRRPVPGFQGRGGRIDPRDHVSHKDALITRRHIRTSIRTVAKDDASTFSARRGVPLQSVVL